MIIIVHKICELVHLFAADFSTVCGRRSFQPLPPLGDKNPFLPTWVLYCRPTPHCRTFHVNRHSQFFVYHPIFRCFCSHCIFSSVLFEDDERPVTDLINDIYLPYREYQDPSLSLVLAKNYFFVPSAASAASSYPTSWSSAKDTLMYNNVSRR